MELYFTDNGLMRFNDDKTRHFIRFYIKNNHLYAYDAFQREENRRFVEIKKINGVKVKSLLEKGFKERDFFNAAMMRTNDIDITRSYQINIKQLENIKYDLYSKELPKLLFHKTHKKSKVLEGSTTILFSTSNQTNNRMLDYASTSFKFTLNMLYNMSKSESDKIILGELIDVVKSVNNTFTNLSGNQDMIYLSTLLLLEEKNYNTIPDYIAERVFELPFSVPEKIMFLDDIDEYDCNDSILSQGKPDPRKLIRMVRNAIAHSNYEVVSEDKIRVFNEKKNRLDLNIMIGKKTLLYILKELHQYNQLDDVFPTIQKPQITGIRFTMKSLIDYLLQLDIYKISKIEIKDFQGEENKYDAEIDVVNKNAQVYKQMVGWPLYTNTVERAFDLCLRPILTPDCKLIKSKLTEKDIEYILNEIDQHDKENFFSLSKSTQVQIIDMIIKKRYNRLSTYHNLVLDNIIINSRFNNESLNIDSHSYINYKSQIELTIISLLNSIFLYSFNQNKSGLNVTNVYFPRYVYETYLYNRVNRLNKLSEDKVMYRDDYTAILKTIEHFDLPEEIINEPIKQIEKLNNQAVKVKGQIGSVDQILYGLYSEQAYDFVNTDLFNRIRDALAHGKVYVRKLDIYDIGNAEIVIEDEYQGIMEFKGVIRFKDILKAISQEEVLKSMLNDNIHFNKHLLTK